MSFDKHSNFNPKANFSEVKFGENMPVLEVELNEMQQIQNEARADIIRDTMPSGFVTLGEIDYDYCVNNDNQIKLKTESIAYVNGYRITIPKDTIIEIGESDRVREDLVFLEVWKEAVNDMNTLTEYGGENNTVINNPIKDSRYPIATSQRVALKYRIRHVADIDFNTYVFDGFTKDSSSVSGFTHNNQQVLAIGGLSDETSLGESHRRFFNYKQRSHYKSIDNGNNVPFDGSTDVGLYVAGNERDRTQFNTIDGYVYAIPMFRLLRKPNVGLASPFEYKKIHNQLDPKKFAHLVGQENVEKVHSVNVQGKTFKNLIGNGYITSSNNNGDVKEFIEPLNPQGTYTLFAWGNLISGSSKINFNFMGYDGNIHALNQIITPEAHEGRFMKRVVKLGHLAGYTVKWRDRTRSENGLLDVHYVVLEGDHSNADLLEPFNYLKSLGESENNSITIENNLLEEGTYVHELQNHILPTHPEVTHVSWGENVVIPPEVEIELKNGEEVIQTITQLPVKLETTGEEKLHVKTMKGQTLVNVLKDSGKDLIISPNTNTPLKTQYLLNTSKKYFVKIFLHSADNVVNESDRCFKIQWFNASDYNGYRNVSYQELKNGVGFIIPPYEGDIEDAFKNNPHIAIWHTNQGVQGNVKLSFMCLEYQDGIEDLDLKYFEGMKSVVAPSVKVTGKNLFNPLLHKSLTINSDGTFTLNSSDWSKTVKYKLKSNTPYTIKLTNPLASWVCLKINNTTYSHNLGESMLIRQFITDSTGDVEIGVFANTSSNVGHSIATIQLEESSTATTYEPYKSNILSCSSEVVLRSLPNGVCDTLNLQTGEYTQRIGEIVLDGSENWIQHINTTSDVLWAYSPLQHGGSNGAESLLCDRLQVAIGMNAIYLSGQNIMLQLNKNDFNISDVYTLKTYLQQNPLTVQYQLATPITKKIGLSEDDYLGKSKITYQLAEPLRKLGTYSDFIKGNTLFSNIGVEVLNGREEWVRQTGTDYGFYLNHPNSMPSTPLISPQLPTLNDWEGYARKGIFRGSGAIGLVVSADDLSENTLQGFKNWLKANPVTIYYVKANPMEIPLKEVSPLECDFSLNRQFKRGYENCLKELPNGVKDVIENGKVKRRTQRVTLTGNEKHEDWSVHTYVGNITNTMAFRCSLNFTCDDRNKLNIVCDKFKAVPVIYFDHNDTPCIASGQQTVYSVLLRVPRSSLSSEDVAGLRLYLKNNPINLICELETSVTEELTEENCRYVPYMPLNSYVGSLYVTNGINQTKFLTAFSPSEYEVQTYHRHFSNDINMFENITSKKSPYGHKTYLEEENGKYVEKFIAGVEKHEIEDLRHKVSLTGFDYSQLLQDSFLKLIKGELS